MKRQEQFPIDSDLVTKFAEVNQKQWKEQKHIDKYIFINFSMVRMQTSWIVPKLIYAKGIEEQTGAKEIAVTWNENPLLTKFFSSFGISHLALNTLIKTDFLAFIKAAGKTFGLAVCGGNGERIKRMKACGIAVGRGIYEDILRTSSLSTVRTVRNKVCLKKTFHLLWMFYALEDYLKKHTPQVFINDDFAYHEGILIKLFLKKGAKVYASSNVGERETFLNKDDEVVRLMEYGHSKIKEYFKNVPEEAEQWTDLFLEERFLGKNGREIDRGAFSGKNVISRKELTEQYKINPNKKNVVIMAHTFTDAVFNYGNYYFRDYYDWVEETLKLAQNITSVNWILKPHPTRSAYNESEDSIEQLFEKYKKEHMYFLSDDVSAESIKYIADVVVTIGGNAGGEFSCFGIPAVIVGKPYYHGFGFTMEPSTREEYDAILKKAHEIEPLTKEQIKTAKQVFYLRLNMPKNKDEIYFDDEFANLLNLNYQEMIQSMALRYFAGNEGTKEHNGRILKLVTEYAEEHDLHDTAYYRKGKFRGTQIMKDNATEK